MPPPHPLLEQTLGNDVAEVIMKLHSLLHVVVSLDNTCL